MSYRIVILNGERRGERLALDTASLALGQGPACDLRIPDPGVALIHAEILLSGEALSIRTCAPPLSLHVNKIEVHEAALKHGDVIEIGSTRLFIQEYTGSATWKAITNTRKWSTLGLPIVLTLIVAGLIHIRRASTPEPASPPARQHPLRPLSSTTNTWPDDSLVTNYPRIQIDPSVVITSKPPELMEAKALMDLLKTNSVDQDLGVVKMELDHGARFLEACEAQGQASQPATNRSLVETELMRAQTALTNPIPQPDRTEP